MENILLQLLSVVAENKALRCEMLTAAVPVEYEAGLWVEFDKWFAVSLELRRAAGAPTVNCSI